MLHVITELFAYIFLELILEGFGAVLRSIYNFLFKKSSQKDERKKTKRGRPYNYDFSKNKQAALIAILILTVIITIAQAL